MKNNACGQESERKMDGAFLIIISLIPKNKRPMKVKLVVRTNPRKQGDPGKWYANPVNAGKKTLRDIAKDIAGRSSLTRGDIENVLTNFMECLPSYLRDGFSVQLGEFGTMRLTLSSTGAADEKSFKTETIKPRVTFTPGVELKAALRDNSYETVKKESLTPAPSPNGEGSKEHSGPVAG